MIGNPVLSGASGQASQPLGQLSGLSFLPGVSKGRRSLAGQKELPVWCVWQGEADVGAPGRMVALLQAQPRC